MQTNLRSCLCREHNKLTDMSRSRHGLRGEKCKLSRSHRLLHRAVDKRTPINTRSNETKRYLIKFRHGLATLMRSLKEHTTSNTNSTCGQFNRSKTAETHGSRF